jgi:hypothetical protein
MRIQPNATVHPVTTDRATAIGTHALTSRRSRRAWLTLAAASLGSLAFGCGYSIRPPYNQSIRTIYLPVFRSQRFRQDQNIQLTEMLRAEILNRTPYKVVANPEGADARLEGMITFDDKNAMVENPQNLPRQILGTMIVNVEFVDNRTGVSRKRTIPATIVAESTPFYPEIGESTTAGFQRVMAKIVRDIVNMMEEPWGEEYETRDELEELDRVGTKPSPDTPAARITR